MPNDDEHYSIHFHMNNNCVGCKHNSVLLIVLQSNYFLHKYLLHVTQCATQRHKKYLICLCLEGMFVSLFAKLFLVYVSSCMYTIICL